MSQCTLCGATFQCGQTAPQTSEPCWCTALPPAMPVPGSRAIGCWCPACLQAHIATLTPPLKAVTSTN
ncbi:MULTISPECIES: cysteine-rich CWC family protein [unclassified Janthinobacterium]|uniref:cysteine-rich CWC family protein n=1 Tax=unclassified Janthinobacterium TaxID=2610881 RepID=UPI000C70DF8A|nr:MULTISPECIES: cysteine-rich CWC family protein [unclassified Janthinobacterium]TDY33053.1 cysteine-rich CWC protein [Janthinobacterium sp. 75]